MTLFIYSHWSVKECNGKYYINSTHNEYLKYLSKKKLITLLCIVDCVNEMPAGLIVLENIKVRALPSKHGYVSSYCSIGKYLNFFRALEISNEDSIYIRVPDPLSWLVTIVEKTKKTKTIVHHYVGDSIEATVMSSSRTWLKWLKIISYLPDYLLTLTSSKFFATKVYANGSPLSNKLTKLGVQVKEVISSTVAEDDILPFNEKNINLESLSYLYVGYIRPSKGVLNLVRSFKAYSDKYPLAKFTIVGDGESLEDIQEYIFTNRLSEKVLLLGHVDERDDLTRLYQNHDIFLFASLSEGSPRVVIEAMANGMAVMSTLVGSLPNCFEDNRNILFIDGYTEKEIEARMMSLREMEENVILEIARQGYSEVKRKYTKEMFLDQVFS